MKTQPLVLVVEDEEDIMSLLSFSLGKAGFLVQEAKSLSIARAQTKKILPDVVVLDWMLSDGEGVAFLAEIRADQRTAQVPVLMLTARAQEADKLKGLGEGADDYITKPFSPKELVARIHTVLRRTAPQHVVEVLSFCGCTLHEDDHTVRRDGVSETIGNTEYQLLKFFLTHKNKTYSRSQLLDYVWGDHVFIEERTVDVHVLRLRKILQRFSAEGCMETVRGVGYRWFEV